MSTVISLNGSTPDGHPVPDIVGLIERLLEKARSGDIQAFAYAAAHTSGNGFSNGWEGNGGTRDELGSAIGHLSHRYFSNAYED